MQLVPPTLKAAITSAVKQARLAARAANNMGAAETAYDNALAAGLTTAIDAYIRSGTVVTTGSATTQTGTIT